MNLATVVPGIIRLVAAEHEAVRNPLVLSAVDRHGESRTVTLRTGEEGDGREATIVFAGLDRESLADTFHRDHTWAAVFVAEGQTQMTRIPTTTVGMRWVVRWSTPAGALDLAGQILSRVMSMRRWKVGRTVAMAMGVSQTPSVISRDDQGTVLVDFAVDLRVLG